MTKGNHQGTITSYASWLLVLDTDYLATSGEDVDNSEISLDQGPGIGVALALVAMLLFILAVIYGTMKMMNQTYQAFRDEEFV